MPKYTGFQCIVCQNTFQDNDDIVVCPDCGTPYHRSCYAAKGECINAMLHAEGKSWQELHRKTIEGRECPNCHHNNEPDAVRCEVCHAPMQEMHDIRIVLPDGRTMHYDPNDPCCGMNPEEELEGERLGDIAEFVGNNTMYYLPLFMRFKETGKKLSLNLPALLFPHLYFANRKMWLMCLLTILAMTICGIPSLLTTLGSVLSEKSTLETYAEYGFDAETMFAPLIAFVKANKGLLNSLDMIFYAVQMTLRVLLCVFSNWLYYRHTLKKVANIRKTQVSVQTRKTLLRTDGGTNFLNMLGAIGITAVMFFLSYMAVVMPFVAM